VDVDAPGGNRVPAQPDLHAGGGGVRLIVALSCGHSCPLAREGAAAPRGGFYL